MNINVQNLTEKSFRLESRRQVCELGQREIEETGGGAMRPQLPRNERRLGGFSAAPCNDHSRSRCQSLIIQYQEDSSLFPAIKSFLFTPSSASCSLQSRHAAPLLFPFSLPQSASLVPRHFKAEWVPGTRVMKAKLIPLFHAYSRHASLLSAKPLERVTAKPRDGVKKESKSPATFLFPPFIEPRVLRAACESAVLGVGANMQIISAGESVPSHLQL